MPNPSMSDIHVNRPLTNISIAYIQEQSQFVADKVFPLVPVQKQSDRYFQYLKEDWFRSDAEERAPGTETAGSGWKLDNTPTYYCPIFGIHKDIDDQIRSNADIPLDMDRDSTLWVTQQLLLKKEQIFFNKYFPIAAGSGTWSTEYIGVSGTNSGYNVTKWNLANSTPITTVTNASINMVEKTGFKPNTIVCSPYVFATLKNHPDVLDRIKYTQRGLVTTDILAGLFDVDNFYVGMATRSTANEGGTEAMSFFAPKSMLLCYSNPAPSILKPSAGYCFSWTGYFGAGVAGNRIKKFRMEQLAADRVEGEISYDFKKVAGDLGVYLNGIVD